MLFWIRPNVGGQFEFPYLTIRINLIPFDISCGIWDGKFDGSFDVNRTSFYQFTCMLHNSQKFNPHLWLGVRNSSTAIGPIGGIEVINKSKTAFRMEYALLKPTPYSFFFSRDELKDFQGTVHYITVGVFKRL